MDIVNHCLAQLAACETKSHKRLHVLPCNGTKITSNWFLITLLFNGNGNGNDCNRRRIRRMRGDDEEENSNMVRMCVSIKYYFAMQCYQVGLYIILV